MFSNIIDEYASNTKFHVDDLSSGGMSTFGQQTHFMIAQQVKKAVTA